MHFTEEQLQLYSNQYKLYSISGLVGIVVNVLILIVLLSKKDLRQNFPYLIALAFADGLNGLAFALCGYYSNDALLYNPTPQTALSCLQKVKKSVTFI